MFDTYKPSGRFGGLAIPLLVLGLIIAVAMGFVYQLLLEWIPLIYVSLLITIGMGIGLGMVGSFIVTTGKVRNVSLAILFGLLLVATSLSAKYYFQYQSMLNQNIDMVMNDAQQVDGLPEDQRAAFREQLGEVIRKQLTFTKHLEARTDQGWNIGRRGNGAPINGVFVYLVWLIEAGILLYYGVTMPRSAAGEPYSEKIDAWASEEEVVMTLPITDAEMVTQIEAANRVDDLLSIPIPKTDESSQFAVYQVNSIEGQELEDAYLSVDLLTVSVNGKGEEETKSKSLVKHAILSSEKRAELLENASLMQEAFADYRAAMQEDAAEQEASDENAQA